MGVGVICACMAWMYGCSFSSGASRVSDLQVRELSVSQIADPPSCASGCCVLCVFLLPKERAVSSFYRQPAMDSCAESPSASMAAAMFILRSHAHANSDLVFDVYQIAFSWPKYLVRQTDHCTGPHAYTRTGRCICTDVRIYFCACTRMPVEIKIINIIELVASRC
jgi:hypothetical protein